MSLCAAPRRAKEPARVSDDGCGAGNGLLLKIPGHAVYILGRNLGWGSLAVCLSDGSVLLLLRAQHASLLNGEAHH